MLAFWDLSENKENECATEIQSVNSLFSHVIIGDMESLVWMFVPPLNEMFVLYMTLIKCDY